LALNLRSKPETRPAANAIYICAVPFAGPPFGEVVPQGQRLRGDHPAVQAAFRYFVPDGTPESEWPSAYDEAIAIAEAQELAERDARREAFEKLARENPVKLEPPRMFRLKRDLLATRDGRPATIRKGSIVLADDELLTAHADDWVEVRS